MDVNEVDVSRKPSKQRRVSKQQEAVTRCLPLGPKDDNVGILQTLLGDPPASIRPFSRRSGCNQQALQSFQSMLDALHQEPQSKEDLSVLDNNQWREIHGYVILQLGNIELSRYSESNHNEALELVTKLCCCLQEIYRLSLPHKPYTNGELQVAFATVADPLSEIISILFKRRDLTLDSVIAASISNFLEVLRILVKQQELQVKATEKAAAIMVRLLCDFPLDPASSVYQHAQGVLKDLAEVPNKEVSNAANMCSKIIGILRQDSLYEINGCLSQLISSSPHTESLVHLRCLSHSRKGATRLSRDLDVLDSLVRWAVRFQGKAHNIEFSCRAAEIISFIALHREDKILPCAEKTTNSEPDWTMDALLKVLTGTSDLYVKACTILGLQCCHPGQIPWRMNSSFLRKILSSLFRVATVIPDAPLGSNNAECHIGATKILLVIVEAILAQQPDDAALSYSEAMCYVNRFLSMDRDPTLHHLAVAALARDTQRNGSRVALRCPTVLNKLGALSCNLASSLCLKQRSMEIFETVTRTENEQVVSILARQPKVLEALVAVASGPSSLDVGGPNPKRVALVVLMRLAQHVCNRRILAKHVGVIACMIRYARSLPDEQQPSQDLPQTSTTLVCLLDLKQKIMELATAI